MSKLGAGAGYKSIKRRLLSSFFFIILLYLTTSLFIFIRMDKFNTQYESMLSVFSTLSNIADGKNRIKTYMLTLSFENDMDTIKNIQEKYKADIATIDSYTEKILTFANDRLRTDISIINNEMEIFKASAQTMLEYKEAGDMSKYGIENQAFKESNDFLTTFIMEVTSRELLESEQLRLSIQNASKKLKIATGVLLICILPMSIIYIYSFSEKISGPVRRITEISKEIAAGNLDVMDLNVKTGDEISILAKTFTEMRDSLRKMVGDTIGASTTLIELFKTLDEGVQHNSSAAGDIVESVCNVNENLNSNSSKIEKNENVISDMVTTVNKMERKIRDKPV